MHAINPSKVHDDFERKPVPRIAPHLLLLLYVCMYVCMYVCVDIFVKACMHVCMYKGETNRKQANHGRWKGVFGPNATRWMWK